MDRVKREILQSKCFDLVREQQPNFNEIIDKKIFPIEGDINIDNLAMSPEDKQRIINDVQIVINCAASIDFNERLCDAFNINYYGCLRMHELVSQCPKVEVFVHVSTAYVNCNRKGFIEEKVYELDDKIDHDQILKNVLAMTPEQQDQNQEKILGTYPNTYTYTKAMAERTLQKVANPKLPIVIIRPSIICGSYKEPYAGWTDTLSAAGGLTLGGGTGMINYIHGDNDCIADLVPVDFVTNIIIASSALYANKPGFEIVHIGTSH